VRLGGGPHPQYLAMLEFASRVRTCPHAAPCCRAGAAAVLGEPVDNCPSCGQPTLPDAECPCLQYLGEAANPATAHQHAAGKA
jgi:hypothetical protein